MASIDVRTIRQRVYDELKEQIATGAILPGQSVSLRTLAADFGVSQMPVREALWQLESEKIICIESNRRMYVNKLTPEEMEECLRIRIMLECQAADLAAKRRPQEAVPVLENILHVMIDATARPREYMVRNKEFHFAIYSHAQSPILLHLIEQMWMRVAPYFIIHAKDNPHLDETQKTHAEMVRSFRDRDSTALVRALRNDLETTAQFILPKLREIDPAGAAATQAVAPTA